MHKIEILVIKNDGNGREKKMNISIAIADANRNYLERLVEVLQEYEELSVSMFTSAELLEQALQSKRFDIVLFDPDISETKLTFFNVRLCMCLYSEDAQNTMLYADFDKVIKYQRVSKMYKEIIKTYADKAGYLADFDHSQNTKIIAVYSPIGGCGKTTVALALASRMASYGKSILFLTLEQLDSSACMNPNTAEGDGITMLIEAIDENANFELKLKGIMKNGSNGFSYIEGFERIVDYNTVTKEEMDNVIGKIRKCGNFDFVIIDMESHINNIGQVVFEQADHIVVVERSGEISFKKIEMFAQQALACEYETKMCKIVNFVENSTKMESQLAVPIIGSIHNYGNQSLRNLIQLVTTKDAINIDAIMK